MWRSSRTFRSLDASHCETRVCTGTLEYEGCSDGVGCSVEVVDEADRVVVVLG